MKAFGNYINGEFVESKSGKTFPNVNPANFDEVVGTFQASNEADVNDACAAAVAAQDEWAGMPATKRGDGQLDDERIVPLRVVHCDTRVRRHLQHGRTLTFAQLRQQDDLPVGELHGIMMDFGLVLVDLPDARRRGGANGLGVGAP